MDKRASPVKSLLKTYALDSHCALNYAMLIAGGNEVCFILLTLQMLYCCDSPRTLLCSWLSSGRDHDRAETYPTGHGGSKAAHKPHTSAEERKIYRGFERLLRMGKSVVNSGDEASPLSRFKRPSLTTGYFISAPGPGVHTRTGRLLGTQEGLTISVVSRVLAGCLTSRAQQNGRFRGKVSLFGPALR